MIPTLVVCTTITKIPQDYYDTKPKKPVVDGFSTWVHLLGPHMPLQLLLQNYL